jgi:hypothetical protein
MTPSNFVRALVTGPVTFRIDSTGVAWIEAGGRYTRCPDRSPLLLKAKLALLRRRLRRAGK